MYNPNVPSSNMGIAPISGQPSQPLGPAPMGPPPPMMGGMPPPPMAPLPTPAPITEGLGGFGGSSAGRAGFSERMQQMTAPPKKAPSGPQPVQQLHGGGMVGGMGGMYGMYGGMGGGGMYGGGMYGGGMMPPMPMPMPAMYQPPMMGYGGMGGMYGGGFGFNRPNRPNYSMGGYNNQNQLQPFQGYEPARPSYTFEDRSPFDGSFSSDPVPTKNDTNIDQGERLLGRDDGMFGSVPRYRKIEPEVRFPQRERLVNRGLVGSIFGSGGLSNYQVSGAQPMANGGSVSSDPVKMALGGFIGNPTTRDYSDDDYIDPYEELDDLYDDIGGYDPTDPFGDSGGGDDGDDYVYVPPVPRPAPPVVVPEPASGDDGDGDIQDRVIADLVYSSADPTVGSSDPSVPDVAPDFGTFTDLIDPYGPLAGQIVQPAVSAAPKAIDAVGAAPIVGSVESGKGEGASTEVDVLGVNPISLSSSGITDRGKGMTVSEMIASGSGNPNNVVFDTSNIPAVDSDFTARRAGEILDSLNVARPGGSSKTRIEDDGLANAMAAAQGVDASEAAAINALGSNAYTGVFEPEFVEPTPAEIQASNLRAMAEARADDAALEPAPFDTKTFGGVGPVTNLGSPILGEKNLTNAITRDGYNPTSSLGLDPAPSDIQLEMAPPTDGGITSVPEGGPNFTARRAGEILESLKTAPRTTAASEAARRSMSDAPLGGDDVLINPLPYTEYGLSRSSGVDAEARRLAQGILAGDNQLNAGGMYPKARDALDNAAKTAAFATQGMTPGTPEYLSTLIETADAASRAGDVPRQRVITDALQQPSGGMDDSSFIIPTTNQPQTFVGGRGPDYIDMTMPGKPSMLESTTDMSGIDSAGNVVSLAGASGYDTPEAAANRANALAQTATTADPDGSGPEVDDVDIFGGNFNRDQFTDREFYKNREDLYSLFGPSKGAEIFNSAVKSLSMGLIDLDKLSAKQREKALEAYLETGKLAYNKDGKLIGVEDPDGRAILLGPQPPKDEDNIGGDDDGCPPGFRRINGVCMPIRQNRVAANPATAISDSINKATLPNTLRPVVRDLVDDDDDEEETSDVGGLTIRRPKYFAGGGAVSEGMGSAIDSFISAMGGSVKKNSNVEPVNMFFGGLVDRFTGRNDYTDPYEELGRDYGYDPTDPFGDGDTSYGDDGPSDTVTADTFIGPMQPNVTYQPPAAPVDTGGDDKPVKALGFQFDPRNANITGLPEIEDFMQRKSAEPYRSEQYIYNEMNPLNKGDITEGLEDNDFLMPEFMRGPLMIGNQYKTSVPQAAIDMGGELATSFYDDVIGPEGKPLEYLGGAAVDLGRSVFDTLYDPPKAVYGAVDSVFDAFGRLGTETNARDRVGNIIGGPLAVATAVTPLGRLGKLTPKNNTISTEIKPSNETLTFYKGSPVAYDPEPGFPLGRARSAYSGTGEGNQRMGSPEALGEVLGAPSGKAWGAGDYQTQSPGTATGYRFMRSGSGGIDAAVKAAQDRVDFIDAGGRPDNFQTIFSEKINAVDDAVKDASLGVKAAENVYADANKTAAERILNSSIFDTSRFRGDPRREIDPQGFYRSVVFGANDQIDAELYAIRDMISNRGNMDYGNPGYSKRMREINRDFPNLINLTDKQIGERRAELRDLSKKYTGDVSKKYIDLTQTYRRAQDAEKAKNNLTKFKTAVTADLPGVLYKTQIPEGKLASFFDYDAPLDNQILTQATNALGVDAMNAKLFGTGPEAKKLQYNPETQQYSIPESKRRSQFSQNLRGSFPVNPTERILAPQTVAEAKLYRDAGITHGQHKTGRKYKKVGDREIPIYNKIFFDDDVTPVPVGRYNRGGQVGMGLGSL